MSLPLPDLFLDRHHLLFAERDVRLRFGQPLVGLVCQQGPTATIEVAQQAGQFVVNHSNWLHRIWSPARQQAGVEWAQFHDLRRANATGLVLEGIDLKTAQTRLGHTDPRLTLGIYAQASTEADRHAAERLGDRFLPRRDHDRGRGLV